MISFTSWAMKVPPLTGPIVDAAGVISGHDLARMDRLIRQVQESHKAQIAVLTVQDLQGESVEQFSINVAESWKLGSAKEDNGVLILFSLGDRKVRIEVGQGLEGQLPDIYAKRIVSDVMIPYFKGGQYSYGLFRGLNEVVGIVAPEFKVSAEDQDSRGSVPMGERRTHRKTGNAFIFFIFVFVFLSLLIRALGGRRRWGSRYGRGGDWGSSSSWGSGSGWGSGGGFSGGGGGFSGGGASGSW